MNYIFILAIIITAYYLFNRFWKNPNWINPQKPFSNNWRNILTQKVNFYNSLNDQEKKQFEYKLQEFLLNCRITGIQTKVDETDKVLIAASAIIPVFNFPNWKYVNLFEVLIYPDSFNSNFQTKNSNSNILGMVGTGYMEGKMILSQQALRHGFANESDKKNTAIHEFVHLIDKMDGSIDGIPSTLLEKQYTIPWLDLINKKIDEIYKNKSDINPYGGTNKAEFFAVISEYFFERPKLLAQNHPHLYALLQEIFNQNMIERKLLRTKQIIGRNSQCPCGSGLKFKKCCGRSHY